MIVESTYIFIRTVLAIFFGVFLTVCTVHFWRWIKKQFKKKNARVAAIEDLHKILELSKDVDNRTKGMEHQFNDFAKRLTEAEKLIQELKNKQTKTKTKPNKGV